jgi:hypothetical protein
VFPSPMTMLTTPGGKPASLKSFPRNIVEKQLRSEGFATTVFPVASAGATLFAKSITGTLNEVIATQTPKGSCFTIYCQYVSLIGFTFIYPSPPSMKDSPSNLSIQPA